ncbi:UNVERIFIED_CONTAM: hypothetical protein NCL1_42759 [Trichonephila clavipes]
MKEIILRFVFGSRKIGDSFFQCGDRARLTSQHVVLFTATLPPQIRPKIGRKNFNENVRVIRPLKCDTPKKDLEDSPECGSNKGPDIIPLSMDPEGKFETFPCS